VWSLLRIVRPVGCDDPPQRAAVDHSERKRRMITQILDDAEDSQEPPRS
jgi:hypothetical protein